MLPEKWAIKPTKENRKALEKFRGGGLVDASYSGYVTSLPYYGGHLGLWVQEIPDREYVEISFQQLQEHILGLQQEYTIY